MKRIKDLELGNFDAISFKSRRKKQFLTRTFYRDENVEEILDDDTYFLIGEKGTGKTAYAVFLANTDYDNTGSSIYQIKETDYEKFIRMKNQEYLSISSFEDAWRVILLLLMSKHVKENEKKKITDKKAFNDLQNAIEKYYDHAFAPEITSAMSLVENSQDVAGIMSGYVSLNESKGEAFSQTATQLQLNLHKIERYLYDALSSLKLRKDHIVFVDGIDIRPEDVAYNDYVQCIKGLGHAAWTLNTSHFNDIKDSPGRMKVVLLLRPDIFHEVGFQNANAKARDNSVLLDWRTVYRNYRTSKIFKMADKMLRVQQDDTLAEGEAWSQYFPFKIAHGVIAEKEDDPFIMLLRSSFYRPRDIISHLIILQKHVKQHHPDKMHFDKDDLRNVQKEYSEYLLQEIKDEMQFYYSSFDFDEIHGLFREFGGYSRFGWEFFKTRYERFISRYDDVSVLTIPALRSGPESMLQFLYSLNMIGYKEETADTFFVHWCFRERSLALMNPRVQIGKEYFLHPGLLQALRLGAPS